MTIQPTPRKTTIKPTQTVQREITKECLPKFDPSNIKTSFKFYIYDLPPMFNKDIFNCMTGKNFAYCYNLFYCGMGEELLQYSGKELKKVSRDILRMNQKEVGFYSFFNALKYTNKETDNNVTSEDGTAPKSYRTSIRNTHQFALEVIIHYKLLHSRYRTLDPSKADLFYIPVYSGLMCQCDRYKSSELVQKLFSHMNTLPLYKSGKPHFSTLGKIQREQGSEYCPILAHKDTANITFIAIEKESNPSWLLYQKPPVYGKTILVAPYPAYVHFFDTTRDSNLLEHDRKLANLNTSQFRLKVPSLQERNVFLFLGCGARRSNLFRAQIMDQFPIKTNDDYESYFMRNNVTAVEQIMLYTNECSVKHRYTTIPWMMRSLFCLQPPGDSPTRKSFYDSILSGCIPIIFKQKNPTEYPFSDKLNYGDFTYTVDEKAISRYNISVLDIVKGIPNGRVKFMHERILQVAKWFQYSLPDGGPQYDDDAMTLILDKLRTMHNLP